MSVTIRSPANTMCLSKWRLSHGQQITTILNMKYLAIVTIAISLICVAHAQPSLSWGVYSDARCTSLLSASDMFVVANPWIGLLNVCTQRSVLVSGRQTPNWFRITSCDGSRLRGAMYSDSGCVTQTRALDEAFTNDLCVPEGGGVQFNKLSCRSSASDTLAYAVHFTVAAAALLLFVQ